MAEEEIIILESGDEDDLSLPKEDVKKEKQPIISQ